MSGTGGLGAVRAVVAACSRAATAPGEAWLAVRMLGWGLVLPVLKSALPLDRLLRLMAVDGGARKAEPARVAAIVRLARRTHLAGRLGRPDNCLERSLVTFRYLSAANADPQLVLGVRAAPDGGVEGHVWVTVDGQAVHDPTVDLATYMPMTIFRAVGGSVHRAAAP